jgi:hypothetical protein
MVHPGDPHPEDHRSDPHQDLKRGTLRSVIAQSGLTVAEFLALL